MYVLRTNKKSFFLHINNVCSILNYIERLNIVFTDLTTFADDSFEVFRSSPNTVEKDRGYLHLWQNGAIKFADR